MGNSGECEWTHQFDKENEVHRNDMRSALKKQPDLSVPKISALRTCLEGVDELETSRID
jgi:hypothetical protein